MSGERCRSADCGWLGVEPFAQNVELDAEASEQPRGTFVASERAQQVTEAEHCAPLVERDPRACHQQSLRDRVGEKRVEDRLHNLVLGTQPHHRNDKSDLGALARRTAAGTRDALLDLGSDHIRICVQRTQDLGARRCRSDA